MAPAHTSIHNFLANALAGSLVAQLAQQRGYDIAQLDQLTPELIKSMCEELADYGFSADQLAGHAMCALIVLLTQENNRDQCTNVLSTILWQILGDPSSGEPPLLYKKAASAAWTTFLLMLSPDLESDA